MRDELASELLAQMGLRVPSKLVDFGRALESFCDDSTHFEWAYFLDKPYKWTQEYTAWANADYPQDGDETWPAFLDAMEALVNA